MSFNHRSSERFKTQLPISLSFGSQITLQGQVKDISTKSAFIAIKSSVHMAVHDELTFKISPDVNSAIEGTGSISRVSPGEGIAIYFTKMDTDSTKQLDQFIKSLR